MRTKPTPQPIDVSGFNRSLAERFGLNRFDGPNVRCVWGDTEREIKPDGRWGLKYFRARSRPVFKGLKRREGSLVLESVFERHELGIERFIVEKFVDPSALPLSDLPRFPRGRYVFLYEVETRADVDGTQGEYRAPDTDTIEHVAEILANEAEDQRRIDQELERMVADEDRQLEKRDREAHDATRRN